jgi:hypothetical protein
MANGRRVVTDGKASTRHVIAGLAEALGGEQQGALGGHQCGRTQCMIALIALLQQSPLQAS